MDIVQGAGDVTISWSRFGRHDQVSIIGNGKDQAESAENVRVTYHHNYFEGTGQRHPKCKIGKVHVYNNYYDEWRHYGIAVNELCQLYAESNLFRARDGHESGVRYGHNAEPGCGRAVNNLTLNGAEVGERCAERVFNPTDFYQALVEGANLKVFEKVEREAGARR